MSKSEQEQKSKVEEITLKNAELRFIREMAMILFKDKGVKTGNISERCWKIWKSMLRILRKKGFRTYIEKSFKRNYAILVKYNFWGSSKGLIFHTNIYPAGFEIGFYQEINVKHPNGGYFDFDKYKLMPEAQKAHFEVISKEIIENLTQEFSLKYYDQSDLRIPPLTAEELIIKHFRECSYSRDNIRSLSEIPSFMREYDIKNNSDGAIKGDILKCGEFRRFKDYNEKMRVGQIFHNINNMW